MRPAFIRVIAMRKLIPAVAVLLLFMGTAQAQYNVNSGGNTSGGEMNMNMMPDNRRHLTPDEAQREREIESQYNQTVNSNKIPDKKGSNDPWGIVRKQQK
jgi:hypothetical protein